MFGFLGFLLILFLLIIFIGFSILGSILRTLFGLGKRNPTRTYTDYGQRQEESTTSSQKTSRVSSSEHKKKIFDDDEGEYVDYEEVK